MKNSIKKGGSMVFLIFISFLFLNFNIFSAQSFSFSGEIRWRFEYLDNFNFLAQEQIKME